MYLSDLRTVLLRRWYLVLVGLVATAGLGAVLAAQVGPTYESRASVVLVPGTATIVEGGNPLLYLGGLAQARDVLVKTLQSDAVAEPFADRHPGTTVELGPDATSSGPLIALSVAAPSDEAARAALSDMLEVVPVELDALQEAVDAPDASLITALVLAADAEPTVVQKDRMRVVAAAVAGGLALTVLLTSAADGLLVARRGRRERHRREPPHDSAPPLGPDRPVGSRTPSEAPQTERRPVRVGDRT